MITKHYSSYFFFFAYPLELFCWKFFSYTWVLGNSLLFSNLPFLHSLSLRGEVSLRWGMFANHWQRQVVFSPLLLLSYLFRFLTYSQSIAFLLRNQSTKGIRSSGMVKKWVVCILHIVGHCIYCRHPTLLHYFSSYYPRTVALVTST